MSSGGSPNQPNLQIMGQYIKDLSFENPSAPQAISGSPELDFGVDVQVRPVAAEHFEVSLHLRIKANNEGRAIFLLELAYAALVRIANIPEEAVQPMLQIQTPHLMFPFARRIVADIVRDGGMPPLMVEPIDFAGLYQNRVAQAAAAPTETV